MDDAYSYEGHDMGIYNLKDGRVKPSYEFSFRKYSATTMLGHPKSQAMPENSNSPQQLPLQRVLELYDLIAEVNN
ncbi:hypothetical protein SCA6_015977 [Theobroma cacao]